MHARQALSLPAPIILDRPGLPASLAGVTVRATVPGPTSLTSGWGWLSGHSACHADTRIWADTHYQVFCFVLFQRQLLLVIAAWGRPRQAHPWDSPGQPSSLIRAVREPMTPEVDFWPAPTCAHASMRCQRHYSLFTIKRNTCLPIIATFYHSAEVLISFVNLIDMKNNDWKEKKQN